MIRRHFISRLLPLLVFVFAGISAKGNTEAPTGDESAVSAMCMTVTTTTTNSLCNSATGTATANVVGGTGPYTYTWSNGQTTQTATGLGTLVYSVTVVDAFGCTQVATADVDNGGPNISNLTVVQPTCNGLTNGSASVTWTGGTGFVFAGWRIPNLVAPANSVANLAPGTWSVGVGDGTGCVDSMRFTIINPPALSLNLNPTQTSCALNNGAITANGSGGTGTLNYNWSNSQTGPTISNLAPGSYTVTMTDANSCQTNASMTINGSSAPGINVVNVFPILCNGGTASMTVQGTSGSPGYSYAWSNGQTGPTATNLAPGPYSVTLTDAALCTAVQSGNIIQPAALSATVTTTPVGCNIGNPDGSATVQVTGGTISYGYQWSTSPVQTTSTASNLPAGSYTVTVTDANGCTTTASASVISATPPSVTTSNDLTICPGAAASLISATATGGASGYTYTWSCNNPPCAIDSVNDNDPLVSPTSTTTYYIQVLDANNCPSNLDSVVVTVLPLAVADAGPDVSICRGDSVQLLGSATGAGPVYTYSWTPVAGLSNATIAQPNASPFNTTTYTLNVTSNGCAGTPDQVIVTVNPVPTVNAGPDISTCFGNQASLTAVSSGANPVTYTWTTGTTVLSQNGPSSIGVSPTVTTMYHVVAVSSANCSSLPDSVQVAVIPFPQANAGPDYGICLGDSAQLLGSIFFAPGDTLIDQTGLTYTWTPATGLSATNIPQPIANPTTSTTYTLTTNYQGCQSANTVQVDVFPLPTVNASVSDSTICSIDSVQLLSTGTVATSYSWTPAVLISNPTANNPIAYPTDSTWFYLTAANGPCAATDSVFVYVGTQPTADFTISDTVICVGQQVLMDESAQNEFDLTWDISIGYQDTTNGDITYAFPTANTYTVTLTAVGEQGCTAQQQRTIEVIDGPTAQFETFPPYTQEQTFPGPDFDFNETATGEVEWIWRFPNDSILYGQNVNHVFLSPGSHVVELLVIDSEGCRDSIIHTITILPNDIMDQNVFSPNGDGINDRFRIEYAGNREYTLMIYDRWGKRMFMTKDKLEGWDGKTPGGADAPEGVYYYTLWVGPKEHMVGNLTLLR